MDVRQLVTAVVLATVYCTSLGKPHSLQKRDTSPPSGKNVNYTVLNNDQETHIAAIIEALERLDILSVNNQGCFSLQKIVKDTTVRDGSRLLTIRMQFKELRSDSRSGKSRGNESSSTTYLRAEKSYKSFSSVDQNAPESKKGHTNIECMLGRPISVLSGIKTPPEAGHMKTEDPANGTAAEKDPREENSTLATAAGAHGNGVNEETPLQGKVIIQY